MSIAVQCGNDWKKCKRFKKPGLKHSYFGLQSIQNKNVKTKYCVYIAGMIKKLMYIGFMYIMIKQTRISDPPPLPHLIMGRGIIFELFRVKCRIRQQSLAWGRE